METHGRSCGDRGWKVHMHVKDTNDPSNHRGSQETGMEHSPSPWTSRGPHHDCRCPACRKVSDYTSVVLRCPFVVSTYISPGKQNQQWTWIFNHTEKVNKIYLCARWGLCVTSQPGGIQRHFLPHILIQNYDGVTSQQLSTTWTSLLSPKLHLQSQLWIFTCKTCRLLLSNSCYHDLEPLVWLSFPAQISRANYKISHYISCWRLNLSSLK